MSWEWKTKLKPAVGSFGWGEEWWMQTRWASNKPKKKRNLPRTCIRSTSMCTIGHNLVMLTVMEKLIFQFISSHVRCTISNTTQTLRVLFSGFSKAFKLWQFQCDAKKQMSKVCNSVSFIFSGFDGQYVCVCVRFSLVWSQKLFQFGWSGLGHFYQPVASLQCFLLSFSHRFRSNVENKH